MLIIISGKTASGKDTLIARILKKYPNFKKVLTSTSRLPRNGEQNGMDYNFISQEQFKQKISQEEFLEHVEYGGNYYGTEKSRVNPAEDLIWKIDPSMAGKVKEIFPGSIVIYISTDEMTILKRLKDRGLSKEEIEKRMQDDEKFWDLYQDKYDFVVENKPGALEETVDKIAQLIQNQSK